MMSSWNLARLVTWLLPAVAPGRALSRGESNTLASLAEVALAGAPLVITPEEVSRNVDAFLVAGRSRHAWRCRVLLQLVEHAPLTIGRARFSRMSRPARAALLTRRLERARGLWSICAMARSLVLLGAYSDPARYAAGWEVPLGMRVRFRRHGARAA
jgi:hypothetical protein